MAHTPEQARKKAEAIAEANRHNNMNRKDPEIANRLREQSERKNDKNSYDENGYRKL